MSLSSLPIEVLTANVIRPLAPPSEGIHSKPVCQQADYKAAQRSLTALSTTCRDLRLVCRPYLYRTLELAAHGRPCQLDDEALSHVRSLVVGYDSAPVLEQVDSDDEDYEGQAATDAGAGVGASATLATLQTGFGNLLSRTGWQPTRARDEEDRTARQNEVMRKTAPHLRRLHLHEVACQETTWAAMESMPQLDTLIVEDNVSFPLRPHEQPSFPSLRQLCLDLPPSATRRTALVLEALLKIISSSPVFEWLCVRTYEATLGRDDRPLFAQSVWRSLKALHLDSGHGQAGFEHVFNGFKAYRDAHPDDEIPLAEITLETRSTARPTFELILRCLEGHAALRKLSFCVVPNIDPLFLHFIAACCPTLTSLHLAAFHGKACVWRNGTTDEYASALGAFPSLETFGWNGSPGIAILQSPAAPKRIKSVVCWHSWGETRYDGSRWRRIEEGSNVLSSKSSEAMTFFPLSPPLVLTDDEL